MESRYFASEGYVKDCSSVALLWHTFLIEPSGFWNLRKLRHTNTHAMMSWVIQLIMEAEKDAVIWVGPLLLLFYCLKFPFSFLIVWPLGLEIPWMEFWEIQWNVVIRICFLLIFSPPSKLVFGLLWAWGEWGKSKHPVTYIFRSFVVLLRNSVNWSWWQAEVKSPSHHQTGKNKAFVFSHTMWNEGSS